MKRFISLLLFLFTLITSYAASYSGTLPVMHIQTKNNAPIVSKEDYLEATYYIDALGLAGYQNVGSATTPLSMEIKGRGNWTWRGFDKKPYRIKLSDKQPLLGMNKSKHFALLAHADDNKGFMRNAVGFELSRMIGMKWTPEVRPIEVILNGDYIGLYFLTETIRVDKDRVNIVEQEDEETDADKITGGWLVEIDNYDDSPNIKITEGCGEEIIFTYKTPEILSVQQEQFLTQEMTRLNTLIYGDKHSDELWQYVDIDALARFYIVQEIVDNYESFHGSCYFYRELGENEKWTFGPVWDFGSAFFYSKAQYIYQGREHHMTWIGEICKFPRFIEHVKKIWNNFYDSQFSAIFNFTSNQLTMLSAAASSDAQRWPKYGNANLSKRISKVNDLLRTSGKWLDERWGIDTSIPEIETNQAPIEYYNMQGVQTEQPIPGQLYIRKQGTQASCVLFGY